VRKACFRQKLGLSVRNREELAFWLFYETKKSMLLLMIIEINFPPFCRKSGLNDFLMLIQTKYGQFCHTSGGMVFFNFFDETGKNHQKSWEKHVLMMIQTNIINSVMSLVEMNFKFFNETEKNHQKSWEKDVLILILTNVCPYCQNRLFDFFDQTRKNHHKWWE